MMDVFGSCVLLSCDSIPSFDLGCLQMRLLNLNIEEIKVVSWLEGKASLSPDDRELLP